MSFTESNLNPGGFGPGDTEWIHLIIGEWQIIANIAQSDLDRKSTRLNSSHYTNSYAVFCLKKKN